MIAAACFAACASGKAPKPNAETARAIAEAYGAGAARGASTAMGGDGGASASGGSSLVAPGGAGSVPNGDAEPDEPDEDTPQVPVEPDEPDEPAPEVEACDAFPILEEACGSSGCHGEGSNLGNFAESEAVARTFIGVGARLTCAGAGPIIDPEDPSESVLVLKLSEDPICGNYMPPSRQFLSAEEIDCVEAWMKNLAP